MRKVLALAANRPATLPLFWAVVAGELSLTMVLFSHNLVPEIALRGLRLFLRF
jgi:hypothetical protein